MTSERSMLLQVADAIEQHPGQFDTGTFFHHEDPETGEVRSDSRLVPKFTHDTLDHLAKDLYQEQCGTTACIAGWAIIIGRENLYDTNLENQPFSDAAAEILGLRIVDAYWLFYDFGPESHTQAADMLRDIDEYGFDQATDELRNGPGEPQ